MHENVINQIKNHISGSLQQCQVHETWPVFNSYVEHVHYLAKLVLKHKGDWLSEPDIYTIFLDYVYKAIRPYKPKEGDLEGQLQAILGEDGINQLTEQILSYIQGIPRTYVTYFPVPPNLPLQNTLEIAEQFRLVKFVSKNDLPQELQGPKTLLGRTDDNLDPPAFFLTFESTGYFGRSFSSSAAKQSLSKIKITKQQALAKDIFVRNNYTPAGLGLLSSYLTYNIPKHFMVCVDKEEGAILLPKLELPIEICHLLDTHTFPKDHGKFSEAVASNEIDKLMAGYLKPTAQLCLTSKPEATRIKTAIEWAFDAYVNDNPTMSFLQTCIALEALYGDDNEGDSITKTLADRCAYLISQDIAGRKTIREKFRQLYKIRSKIVHGSASGLAPEQIEFLSWGKSVLKLSIFKEIKHLALD